MFFRIRPNAGALASACLSLSLCVPSAEAQTLRDFVDAAASRNAELAGLSGRRDAIGARQYAADALTPGAPMLSGSYTTDQVFRNRQQREAQIGISTPLWLPGEGSASRRVADAEWTRSAAQAAAARLKVAGQVRDGLAEFVLAQAEVTAAERRLRDARALEADVTRRARAREAAEADVLLARAERIAADGELRDRRAALEQGRLDFQSLTGMPPRAAALDEPVAIAAANTHPQVEDAKGALDIANANRALAAIQVRENPEIGLVAHRSRDMNGTAYNHSVGIELRIPLATEARNRPRQAAAQAELTEATAGYASTERETRTEQQKARIGYDNALVQRDLARERARTLAQQSGLIARGYQAGQLPLSDTLRARALAYEAEAAGSRAEIGVAKARNRLNQAFGVAP